MSLSGLIVPLTVTTDEIVDALHWAMRQADHATQTVIGRDNRISRHIADQIAKENKARRAALYELLKAVQAQASHQDWVTVPTAPTAEMLQGGCAKHRPGEPMSDGSEECPAFRRRRRIWADMIALAPRSPT